MSLALLFAGQGTQHADMLPWLDGCAEAAPILAAMAAHIGADWRSRLADPEWAQDNAVAQPLLTGLGLAAWQVLAPRLPAPAVIAGYSVGELAAYCAAGVFDAAQALALAVDRAAAMDRSVAGLETGLLSVQGADAPAVRAACERHGVAVALELAADRVVLGGLTRALAQAAQALAAAGAHCKPLPVRLASHTPWMAAAADAFEARLSEVPMARPTAVLVCNPSGAAERDPPRLRHLLARQIASPVRWSTCMDTLAERRVRCVLEVGGGQALAKLWRERHPDVPARSVDEFRSPQAIARWVDALAR
jgi:[acyl-carrier-protein] S-malonyltransferase